MDNDEQQQDEREERAEGLSRRQLVGGGLVGGAGLTVGNVLAACGGSKTGKQQTAQAAGGAGLGNAGGASVRFVVHDNNPFFVPVRRGFEAFGKQLGWKTAWSGPPKQDIAATVNLQSDAINAKPDGVIFTRIDNHSFDANIKRAQDEGIQVILSNVATAGYEKLGVGFVGQDFIPAGVVCGQAAAKASQEKSGRKDGVIVTTNIAPGNSALDLRQRGIKQGIAAYNKDNGTNFTTTDLVTSTDQSEATGRIDAKFRKEGANIVGWATAAIDHQFVAQWAKDNNKLGKMAIGGFDLIAPILRAIKAGDIQFTIGQNPWAQGWIASALLAMQLYPGYPSFAYDTGAEVVDSSNIDAVLKREQPFLS